MPTPTPAGPGCACDPLGARAEAYGWAVIYGLAWGPAVAAWQDAAAVHARGWTVLFGVYAVALVPAYFALQWRELRG